MGTLFRVLALGDGRSARRPVFPTDSIGRDMIQAKALAALDGVQHRFFTRNGGVSAGLYSSLNCGYGSGDSPDNVRENRRRVAATFGLGEPDLLTLHQIHSTEVLTVGEQRWTSPGAPKADGLVTDRPGVVLGVMAADCAPVLLADRAPA